MHFASTSGKWYWWKKLRASSSTGRLQLDGSVSLECYNTLERQNGQIVGNEFIFKQVAGYH